MGKMGHTDEVYILLVVMELRGNRRFWGLDKKFSLRATGFVLCRGLLDLMQTSWRRMGKQVLRYA